MATGICVLKKWIGIRGKNEEDVLMIKNTLGDLNGYLFEQLERLNDEDMDEDTLKTELRRSKAVAEVAKQIIENGKLVLDAQKFVDKRNDAENELPKLLEG